MKLAELRKPMHEIYGSEDDDGNSFSLYLDEDGKCSSFETRRTSEGKLLINRELTMQECADIFFELAVPKKLKPFVRNAA